jgi:hypothetical protein
MPTPLKAVRALLMVCAGLALLTGMWVGLARMGWALPTPNLFIHGPLMISGFLGTLISLERAVALRRNWTYAAPALTGLGGLTLLIGFPEMAGRALITLGSLALLIAFGWAYRRHYGLRLEWATATIGLGGLCWLAGNSLWLVGQPLYQVTPWWIGFLLLTILGERLELAQVALARRARLILFVISIAILVAGLLLSRFTFVYGLQLCGLGLLLLGLWLIRFDVARGTIRRTGLTRFIAACLLPGYFWLMAAGLLWLWWPAYFGAGPFYDAMLHMVLLGFVFSLIFGHAPIIFPAILDTPIYYRPAFYAHLALLHLSVLLRAAGDLNAMPSLRMWAGWLNVAAILIFLGNTILSSKSTSSAKQ